MPNWAAANHRRANEPGAGLTLHAAPGAHHDLSAADLLLPVGQAMMIATNRSVSYWLGLAHILQSHQMTLTEVMSAAAIDRQAAGSERLAMADRLRELLREVGDLATREARILQNELKALDESLTQTFQQPELSSSYRRRWRVKI